MRHYRYRFSNLSDIATKLEGFKRANIGNPAKVKAATAALCYVELAYLAYGMASKRDYLVKAQNAFRLAFL